MCARDLLVCVCERERKREREKERERERGKSLVRKVTRMLKNDFHFLAKTDLRSGDC